MIVTRREADRIATGRQRELRIPMRRRAPAVGARIPITYRAGIEFSKRTLPIRTCRAWVRSVDLEGKEWVIGLAVCPEHTPRLLAAEVIAGRQGAYVESPYQALSNEPEAIDELTQRRYSREANARDAAREEKRRRERGELPFEQELAILVAEARARHIDIRSEVRAIRRWREPFARKRQLELIRRKVDTLIPAV